ILLKHCAVVIDDKSHHAGIAVFGRIGDQCEATNHFAVHDVIGGAAGRRRSLLGQDLVVVAVIRRAAFARAVTLARRVGEQFAEWAFFLTLRGWPIQAILLAGLADEALSIGALALAAIFRSIVILRVHIGKAGLNRVEFVVADAPSEDFLPASHGVERPSSILVARQWDRERIIIVADHQDRLAVAPHRNLMLGVIGGDETRANGVVGDFVAR